MAHETLMVHGNFTDSATVGARTRVVKSALHRALTLTRFTVVGTAVRCRNSFQMFPFECICCLSNSLFFVHENAMSCFPSLGGRTNPWRRLSPLPFPVHLISRSEGFLPIHPNKLGESSSIFFISLLVWMWVDFLRLSMFFPVI